MGTTEQFDRLNQAEGKDSGKDFEFVLCRTD